MTTVWIIFWQVVQSHWRLVGLVAYYVTSLNESQVKVISIYLWLALYIIIISFFLVLIIVKLMRNFNCAWSDWPKTYLSFCWWTNTFIVDNQVLQRENKPWSLHWKPYFLVKLLACCSLIFCKSATLLCFSVYLDNKLTWDVKKTQES